MSDFDKQQWQAEQQARDAAFEKQREKERKTRERSARNVQRKLQRLRRTLSETDNLSDWEDEFSGSVADRLDKYGAAFHDLEKGRPGDALSFAQKRVVAALNKKAKDQRKAARLKRQAAQNLPSGDDADHERPSAKPKFQSSFKPKNKKSFTPRVRQIDDDFDGVTPPKRPRDVDNQEPFIPDFNSPTKPQKPFLRLVKTGS